MGIFCSDEKRLAIASFAKSVTFSGTGEKLPACACLTTC
jgi:hypothetical protein